MRHNSVQPQASLWRQTILPSLSLFTSVGTLLCCALPALLVSLGMGAALAGLVGSAPWVTALSDYKIPVFAVAGGFIALSTMLQWRARKQPCPADPKQAKACARFRKISRIILMIAALLFAVGFFFSFMAVHVLF